MILFRKLMLVAKLYAYSIPRQRHLLCSFRLLYYNRLRSPTGGYCLGGEGYLLLLLQEQVMISYCHVLFQLLYFFFGQSRANRHDEHFVFALSSQMNCASDSGIGGSLCGGGSANKAIAVEIWSGVCITIAWNSRIYCNIASKQHRMGLFW